MLHRVFSEMDAENKSKRPDDFAVSVEESTARHTDVLAQGVYVCGARHVGGEMQSDMYNVI